MLPHRRQRMESTMINWQNIDHVTFEKIAYEYITNTYPNLKWLPTKHTRDGNKDGFAICDNPMGVTIKYWYEAKYSKALNRSIPKSHLDSTLVSCLLDGKVVVIAFITNTYISDDYRRRADIFSKQRDNLKIIYVNGTEIEDWFNLNPNIEKKYFNTNTAKSQNFKSEIKDYCILEKYGLSGEVFSKVNNLELEKEYVLYVSFYSKKQQIVSIKPCDSSIVLIDNSNRLYDNCKELEANIGYNNYFITMKIINKPNKEVSLCMETYEQNLLFTIDDISIVDIYNPIIIYESQIKIKNSLFSILKLNETSNAIFFVEGNAGAGKTYLLNDIYNDNKNPFSSYVVSFCGDNKQDAISCFKIIILSMYGDIWNFSNGDDCFSSFEQTLISQIQNKQLIGNSVDDTIKFFENNKESIIRNNKSVVHIFVDDFHKLSTKNRQLLNVFAEWFLDQQYNCKMIIFSRPESEINIYTKKYTIGTLMPNDVKNTIKKNFAEYSTLPQIVSRYPIPLNTLHLIIILSEIHDNEQCLFDKNELEMNILLNNIYKKSISLTNSTLGEKILKNYKTNLLVYCVYKVKTGIPIVAFDYFNDATIYDNLYELMQKRIVKEVNDNVMPYHDILVSSFGVYNNENLNRELEKFIVFSEKNGLITRAKMFSVLIAMGKRYFWKYRNEAEKYRDELHQKAAYHDALEIAENLEVANTKNLYDYSENDCWNLFIKANCIKYTLSHQLANEQFQKISDIYNYSQRKEIQGIYLEAETEMINDYIWMLEITNAQEKLDKIKSIFLKLYNQDGLINDSSIRAFLNYYNRCMFVNYMKDKGSEEDFNLALSYSIELQRKDYEAFANIDYAKCLYVENINSAKNYMNNSLDILNELCEPRRKLDAESELWFMNCLESEQVIENEYLTLLKRAITSSYAHTATKIRLKWIFLNILFSDIPCNELREQLYVIVRNNASATLGKRNQLYINHLIAALYYKENNFKETKNYSKQCQEYTVEMGDSYKKIHENNSKLKHMNGFVLLHDAFSKKGIINTNKFILDTRLW